MSDEKTSGVNYGVMAHEVKAKNLAVGENARAGDMLHSGESKSLDQLQARLQDLLAAIEQHKESLPPHEAAQIQEATESVAGELSKDKPNKITIMGTLNAIIDSVKSVTGIMTAAEALKQAAVLFFH